MLTMGEIFPFDQIVQFSINELAACRTFSTWYSLLLDCAVSGKPRFVFVSVHALPNVVQTNHQDNHLLPNGQEDLFSGKILWYFFIEWSNEAIVSEFHAIHMNRGTKKLLFSKFLTLKFTGLVCCTRTYGPHQDF